MPGTVNLFDPATKKVFVVDEADAPAFIADGWRLETPTETAERSNRQQLVDDNSGVGDKIQATLGQAASIGTLGLSDVAIRTFGGEEAAEHHRIVREVNPGATNLGTGLGLIAGLASGGSGAAGTFARATPAGVASRAALAIGRAGEEAGAITRIARGAAGAGFEGAAQGAGQAVGELALLPSDDLTMDYAASLLKSRTMTGATIGGIAGGGLSTLEVGLGAAARRLKQARAAADRVDSVSADLADLDRRGLRAAEEAELAAIEAGRVPQRQAVADDLGKFRAATKAEKPWEAVATGNRGKASDAAAKKLADQATDAEADALAWEAKAARHPDDAGMIEAARAARAEATAAKEAADAAAGEAAASKAPRWMRELGKVTLQSDRALDRLLTNPKALTANPRRALEALQQQEHALETILAHGDELRALHAADTTGRRAAAFSRVEPTLQANRALQVRIGELAAAPASARLTSIRDAVDALAGAGKKTLGQQMASGAAYGLAADVVRAVPFIGPMAAPLVAARVADAVGGKIGGELAAAVRGQVARAQKAVDAFLAVTKGARQTAGKLAPIIGSKVLAGTRFGPEAPPDATVRRDRRRKPTIEESFAARAAELTAATAPGPDGRPVVRPHARALIGEQLAPIAAVSPIAADKLETRLVRRLEFLAAKMPKTTMLGLTRIPPNEIAIRAFARYVAAADDPAAIEERLAEGTVTPEDAEVMRELYPARQAEITRMVMERLHTLRGTLPYRRRLALSIFTGVPVDALMEPGVLRSIQAMYQGETGTEGGTKAPQARAAFGSVKKSTPEPTPAQRRAG